MCRKFKHWQQISWKAVRAHSTNGVKSTVLNELSYSNATEVWENTMLKTELFEIIANGENSGVDFKRDDIRPEQLAKEVVAMANFQGGRLLLGVEDDGMITGIQRDNLEEWVMNVFQGKIHPMILPFYEEVRMDDGKAVAIISFPMGISKPYVVRDRGREEVYIRVGSTSRLATREQQMRLFELGGLLHTDNVRGRNARPPGRGQLAVHHTRRALSGGG